MIFPMKISGRLRHFIRNLCFAVLGTITVLCSIVLIWVSTIQLPDFSSFNARKEVNSTKIYDRTGTILLYNLGSNKHRTSIPYTDMGVNIKNATVAIEDGNFYQNYGIEPKAIIRALIADITKGHRAQGGSTITQQVIKKSILSDDKTIVRKIKEVILALKLNRSYTKDEILGMYLNEIPYGGNIYGIEEASQTFLGKAPRDLTLAESAYLASIPNAPTRYSPYGSHKDELENRKNLVLFRMNTLGFISDTEYMDAKAEKVVFKEQSKKSYDSIKAPHFVFFIKDYLEQKYGVDTVESGGLKVISTLDLDLQSAGEKAVVDYTTGKNKQIEDENAGLVAIDPKTGQILTMVGSRNYFDQEIDGNFNVTTARRQPGSSFKPFMYATAFKMGYTPETVLFDVPTEFYPGCNPYGEPYGNTPKSLCYSPGNYDNTFHGPMTIREALARSMNIPAVKMLYLVGVKNAIKTAQDMGVTTLNEPEKYGLSLVLGGGEVRLLEETSAYGVFATGGVRHPYSAVLSVEDKDGNKLEEWQDQPVQVLDKNISLQISSILSDNVARTPTFGAHSPLYFPDRQVAAKTGTTNGFKDSWTVGYTPSLVAGVWLGKNENTSMPQNVIASPIFHQFMVDALKKYPNETFEEPVKNQNYSSLPPVLRGFWQGNEGYIIDTISGKLATEFTPKETQKEYIFTDVHDILHWINKENPLGGKPENPNKDPLYNNWETTVRNWWATNSYRFQIITQEQKPTLTDDVHTQQNMPVVTITSPTEGQLFKNTDQIVLNIQPSSKYPFVKSDVFLNNKYVGTTKGPNPIFTLSLSELPQLTQGSNTISVSCTDSINNTTNANVTVIIE